MKRIFLFIILTCFTYSLFAIDGRAIRSNWECMASEYNCVALDQNNSIHFTVSLMFQPNQYSSIDRLYLKTTIDNQTSLRSISIEEINNGTIENKIISYDQNGVPQFADVVVLQYPFAVNMAANATSFSYDFSLVSSNDIPFPIAAYPNLMAMIKTEAYWPDYTVDEELEITESGIKAICPRGCILPEYSQSPAVKKDLSESSHSNVTIHPNPFSDQISITFENNVAESTTFFEILDLQGKMVMQVIKNEVTVGRNTEELVLEDLAAGVYFCRISSADGVKTIKLVKQRE